MVGRLNSGSLVDEGQDICPRCLQLAPPTGQLQTSWNNGRYPQEWSLKRIKRTSMKVHGMSLGIDVSHGDFPIAALAVHLGNAHLPLHTGTTS